MDYFLCGKNLVGELFFSRNHPFYRKLFLFQDFDMACMPDYMWKTVSNTIGVKVNGKGETGDVAENFDFIVKDVNKKLESTLSWAPTKIMWIIACRTYNLCVSLSKKVSKWTERWENILTFHRFLYPFTILSFFFSTTLMKSCPLTRDTRFFECQRRYEKYPDFM